ncbi:MAG: hypothetical protein KAR38_17495, partial [Calditrichia bacterium]|nr:hypothetical protein [Calditrichia bacterium]
MKKIAVVILFIMLFTMELFAEKNEVVKYREFHTKAVNAYYAKDYKGWLEFNKKAVEIMPNHPRSIYYLADAYALNGNKEEAVRYLKRAVEMGFGWNAGDDEDFSSLKSYPDFKKILARIDELKKPVNNSRVAFTLNERDIIPEGLAYDPVEQCFYLSSIYKSKIVKIDKNGNATNFSSEKQDGLRPVVGMKVDVKRRILWVCTEVSSLN